jgi:N6-L-threonylcarbamoyladenine synthase
MTILGIETSCDETAAAVIKVDKNNRIELLSNSIATSLSLHAQTGGIIPEVAAREQVKFIIPVIEQALEVLKNPQEEIDAIAVTVGPGLIGSLLVGVETARTFAYVWDKPLIPVNHLFGHIYANFIGQNEILFPAIALIVSGGHTDLVLMKDHKDIQWLG